MKGLGHSLLIEGALAGKPALTVAPGARGSRVTMATAARQWGVCPHYDLFTAKRHLVHRLRVPLRVATFWWWLVGAAMSAWYTAVLLWSLLNLML